MPRCSTSIRLSTAWLKNKDRRVPVLHRRKLAITGTPADCVRLGVLHILPEKPDIVLSGINYGFNVGTESTMRMWRKARIYGHCLTTIFL